MGTVGRMRGVVARTGLAALIALPLLAAAGGALAAEPERLDGAAGGVAATGPGATVASVGPDGVQRGTSGAGSTTVVQDLATATASDGSLLIGPAGKSFDSPPLPYRWLPPNTSPDPNHP